MYVNVSQSFSSDGNAQNKVVLKNFLYVYKNYSVHESFAQLARDYYLADVKTVARPDLEVTRAVTDGAEVADDAAAGKTTSDDVRNYALNRQLATTIILGITWLGGGEGREIREK